MWDRTTLVYFCFVFVFLTLRLLGSEGTWVVSRPTFGLPQVVICVVIIHWLVCRLSKGRVGGGQDNMFWGFFDSRSY